MSRSLTPESRAPGSLAVDRIGPLEVQVTGSEQVRGSDLWRPTSPLACFLGSLQLSVVALNPLPVTFIFSSRWFLTSPDGCSFGPNGPAGFSSSSSSRTTVSQRRVSVLRLERRSC